MAMKHFDDLVEAFSKLQGVGKKSARRYAYNILNMDDSCALELANAIISAKKNIHQCALCGDYTESEICDICKTRDSSTICVVAEPKDILVIEQTRVYNGVYHVLGGLLNPIFGKGPSSLRIKELFDRLDGVKEVIMATSATQEGNATAEYIAEDLRKRGITVTKLAQGIAVGTDIEYLDEYTMQIALSRRQEIK